MTVPTNTTQTVSQTNIREDLSNKVYMVDPFKTPFLTMSGRAKAESTYHEWDTDSLAAQDLANAQIQGDDATADATNPTARLGNYTQISRKVVQLAGTLQAVRAAGGTNKMGYQLLKASKALKRDMEGILTNNVARTAPGATTAAVTGGLCAYLTANTVFQTGGTTSGANPTGTTSAGTETFGNGTTPRTDNTTTAAITETMIDEMAQLVFQNSGDCVDYLLVSSKNKQAISKFTGPGTRFTEVEDKLLKTAIDEYETDFGKIRIVPDLFLARSRDCFGIKRPYAKVAYLRPYQVVPLAKTGDSDKKMLICEYALELGNERACGGIFDTAG